MEYGRIFLWELNVFMDKKKEEENFYRLLLKNEWVVANYFTEGVLPGV